MRYFALVLLVSSQGACAQEQPDEAAPTETTPVAEASSVSEVASIPDEEIFRAAGFELTGGSWGKCGDPGTPSYEAGAIMERGDFNGDGLADALVTEGGTYCFGMTGAGYTLVTRRPDGSWSIMDERVGIPEFLETKGTDGWPDIEVGGPGFCFPVRRWNGQEYALHRSEYEGSACSA